MQPKARKQGDNDIAEGGGRKDKGEVGPRKRGEVTGEKADEERYACGDPWGEDCGDEVERVG